jgi:hypothetical protein
MIISLAMLALEAALAVGADPDHARRRAGRRRGRRPGRRSRCASRWASPRSSRGCSPELGAPVSGWRWPLIWAAAAAWWSAARRFILLPEWAELIVGIPAILVAFFAVLWTKGFGPEDRELFR